MPQVIVPAAIAAGAETVAGYIAGEILVGEIIGAFATAFAINVVIGGALYALSKKSSPDQGIGVDDGRKVNIRSSIAPRRVVYGEAVISGPLVAYFATDSTVSRSWTESHTIPKKSPYTVKVANASTFDADYGAQASGVEAPVQYGGLTFQSNSIVTTTLTKVASSPAAGQYSVSAAGVYTFNAHEAGKSVLINYKFHSTVVAREWHSFVIALAGHELAQIGEVFLDAIPVGTLDADGYATTGTYAGHVQIIKHLGGAGQAADATLKAIAPSQWTNAHVGNGVAYVIVRLKRNPTVFPQGVPAITCYVRGKPLYDPRDGATRWSNNWALVVRDYMTATYGLACAASEIDDASIIAAANACEERVAMATHTQTFTANASTDELIFTQRDTAFDLGDGVQVSSTGTLPAPLAAVTTYYLIRERNNRNGRAQMATTYANALAGVAIDLTTAGTGTMTMSHIDQARYACDGTFTLDARPLDILQSVLTAGAGAAVFGMGAWHLFAGVYASPAVTIDADWLRGPIGVHARLPRKDLFNAVRGTYISPFNNWSGSDFPAVRNASYVTQDNGEEIFKDIELSFTINTVRAQRIAKIALEKSRQQISVQLQCNLRAFKVAVWDTVQLTFPSLGWSSKVFRVTSWTLAEDAQGVDLSLVEDTANSYAWDSGNATLHDPAPDTELNSAFVCMAPGPPSIVEALYETSGSGGVKTQVTITCDPAPDAYVDEYQFEFRASDSDSWTRLPLVPSPIVAIGDVAAGIYDFRVAAVNGAGIYSLYATSFGLAVVGLSAPPADVSNFSVRAIGGHAMVTLDQAPDLDVRIGGRLMLRWSPLTVGATWNDGSLLAPNGWPGDSVMVIAPLYGGTYMAKWLDSSGNYSANAASFVVTESLLTGFTTLVTQTENPAFAGAKTNVTVVDGTTLELDGAVLWDDLGLIDSLGIIDAAGGVATAGSYAFASKVDLGSVKTVRAFPTLTSLAFDSGDLWDLRTADIDSWGLVDGSAIEDAEAMCMVRITIDDPNAGSPAWGPWHTLPGPADYTCRGFDLRLDFTSGSSTHNRGVTALSLAVKQAI